MTLKLGMHRALEYYQCFHMMILGWPWPFLWPGSNLFQNASEWVKAYIALSANVFASLFQFSISSALRWAIQDQWSSGLSILPQFELVFFQAWKLSKSVDNRHLWCSSLIIGTWQGQPCLLDTFLVLIAWPTYSDITACHSHMNICSLHKIYKRNIFICIFSGKT